MQAEMALKEEEAQRQKKRIQELEEMQKRLEEALQQEIKARIDEEAFRLAQAGCGYISKADKSLLVWDWWRSAGCADSRCSATERRQMLH